MTLTANFHSLKYAHIPLSLNNTLIDFISFSDKNASSTQLSVDAKESDVCNKQQDAKCAPNELDVSNKQHNAKCAPEPDQNVNEHQSIIHGKFCIIIIFHSLR